MNSPAIRQNADSWPRLFAEHLESREETQRRCAANRGLRRACWSMPARRRCCSSTTITCPFASRRHSRCGRRSPTRRIPSCSSRRARSRCCCIHQPVDYWHKSPEMPNDYWTERLRHRELRRSRRGARRAAQGSLAHRVHRRALSRTARLGTGGHQSGTSHRAARLRARGEDCRTKSPACARRTCSVRAVTSPPSARSAPAPANSRSRSRSWRPAASASASCLTTRSSR